MECVIKDYSLWKFVLGIWRGFLVVYLYSLFIFLLLGCLFCKLISKYNVGGNFIVNK